MKRLPLLILLYLAGLLLTLGLTFTIASDLAYQEANRKAQYEADNVAEYINSELARYRNIPQLLSSNYLIRKSLSSLPSRQSKEDSELNQLLLEISESSGTDDLYVLNNEGVVIAASNFRTPRSFVGGNFAFRPYFSLAAAGENTSYYALGLRSGERGAFFSAPVIIDGKIAGVVALKISVAQFEQNAALLTGDTDAHLVAYGADNVVFISNQPQWRLKQLSPSAQISWQQVLDSQRYLDLAQSSLHRQQVHTFFGQPLWQLTSQQPAAKQTTGRYSAALAEIPVLKMSLAILLPYKMSGTGIYSTLLWSAFIYLTALPALFFLYRRLAGYRQLLFTRSSLEREVQQRTEELDQAHQALIQSAKLATIGQLSASINHEINQPLSAISAYLVSSKRMLIKGNTDALADNLETIESLIHRTHRIVSQLKQFSRQESEALKPVSLQQSLSNTLLIVEPELKKQAVTLSYDNTESLVLAEPLKLEQVLVNLISNAVDAMAESPVRQLNIHIETQSDQTLIELTDSGPGLDLQKIDTIFEPFFTTKSNHGSGLGLSIARNIIDSFGGSLSAANSPEGGAVFTLLLKQASPQRDAT